MIDGKLYFDITDVGIYKIETKVLGTIGYLKYDEKLKQFVFFPSSHKFYPPSILALILNKLNEINEYKKLNVNKK